MMKSTESQPTVKFPSAARYIDPEKIRYFALRKIHPFLEQLSTSYLYEFCEKQHEREVHRGN
ncbi:MAG TPA: hypothetical protein VMW72_01770 [Sedimentisphaerales bacterium]|nr:hypothetical protein [Sedimentisphaerales bacterium]